MLWYVVGVLLAGAAFWVFAGDNLGLGLIRGTVSWLLILGVVFILFIGAVLSSIKKRHDKVELQKKIDAAAAPLGAADIASVEDLRKGGLL